MADLTALDILAARAAARQYRIDARRLRLAAEEAVVQGKPLRARALRYTAQRVANAATAEMQAIERGSLA